MSAGGTFLAFLGLVSKASDYLRFLAQDLLGELLCVGWAKAFPAGGLLPTAVAFPVGKEGGLHPT